MCARSIEPQIIYPRKYSAFGAATGLGVPARLVTPGAVSMVLPMPSPAVRLDRRDTLSSVEDGLAKEPAQAPRPGEQITWAMTLGRDVGFRWWLQRSWRDSS